MIGAATIDPKLLTAAERLRYEGYLRRGEFNPIILAMAKDGIKLKEIVRRTGHSRRLVRRIVGGQRSNIFRPRESSLEFYLQRLDEQWAAGHHNGSELWRRLKIQGFRDSLRVVSEWATCRRRAEKAGGGDLTRTLSARATARLMTFGRDNLTKSETVTVVAIEDGIALLVEARQCRDDRCPGHCAAVSRGGLDARAFYGADAHPA